MTLKNALAGEEYVISAIETDDVELNSFLLTLGCYSGENVTVISQNRNGLIISLRGAKYNIDNTLANAISV